jgi:hypothetical protein
MSNTVKNNGIPDFRAQVRIRESPELKTEITVNPSKHSGHYKYHLLKDFQKAAFVFTESIYGSRMILRIKSYCSLNSNNRFTFVDAVCSL